MSPALPVREQRRHLRVQLNLPVRLRWLGPFRPILEITQTLDISRDGFAFYRPEPCLANSRVWVMLPFNNAVAAPEPEIPARVVRQKETSTGGHMVGVELEMPRWPTSARFCPERRSSPRVPLAMPIRVRTDGNPWPEETMTIDVSNSGTRFASLRVYGLGEALRVALSWGRWERAGEIPACVVRVGTMPGTNHTPLSGVGIAWDERASS